MRRLLLLLTLLCAAACNQRADAVGDYKTETVFRADGVIWSFAFLSARELLVTLRRGELLYVNLAGGTARALPLPLNIAAAGQGGLLDVHFRPRDNGGGGDVYLTYSAEDGDELTTALARGVWNGETLAGLETIFTARVEGDSGRHFGSRLLFAGGAIFMTIGDRAERDRAQDLSFHNGKILRLNADGTAAAGNPFADNAAALPEIWSYGHRNPQGIGADAGGAVYSVEFGPRGGDELNRVEAGKNYGWPVISDGYEYWGPKFDTHHPGMERPLVFWTPSISPSGMAFYTGDKIPEWRGNLFVAALGERHLRRLVLEDGAVTAQEALFAHLDERIRHIRTGADGHLYFSTDSGKLVRVLYNR